MISPIPPVFVTGTSLIPTLRVQLMVCLKEIQISVIVPVCDEEGNVAPLIGEIERALPNDGSVEMIFIDDGSHDGTASELLACRDRHSNLRILTHLNRSGQSRAIRTGVLAARGRLICVLDGDGQNDPADLPRLIERFKAETARGIPVGMVMGERRERRDSKTKRMASRIANGLNRTLLRHEARDVGCGLKVLSAEIFRRLPYFDHMHRFMPALVGREGHVVCYETVGHRARAQGKSKYGTLDRALSGILDLIGVYWLIRRSGCPGIREE